MWEIISGAREKGGAAWQFSSQGLYDPSPIFRYNCWTFTCRQGCHSSRGWCWSARHRQRREPRGRRGRGKGSSTTARSPLTIFQLLDITGWIFLSITNTAARVGAMASYLLSQVTATEGEETESCETFTKFLALSHFGRFCCVSESFW